MIINPAEVVRHFLKLEATRRNYSDRKDELLSWCTLSNSEVMAKARDFAVQRDDRNPVSVYTIGLPGDDRHTRVANWTLERINCREIFSSGIAGNMEADINAVKGNLYDFANGPANKYDEFRPLGPLCEITGRVIVVAKQVEGRKGKYEAIDGSHRLVALCRNECPDVEAFVAHM